LVEAAVVAGRLPIIHQPLNFTFIGATATAAARPGA